MIYGKPRRINETDAWRDESAWREYYTRANQKQKAKRNIGSFTGVETPKKKK